MYANRNILIKWSTKTISGTHFEIIGTKLCNKVPP